MPNLSTDRYDMLRQECKDCPWLTIKPDGIHVDCDPPEFECKLEVKHG